MGPRAKYFGMRIIGNGEAAGIAMAKHNDGILARMTWTVLS